MTVLTGTSFCLSGGCSGRLKWVAGVYFENSWIHDVDFQQIPGISTAATKIFVCRWSRPISTRSMGPATWFNAALSDDIDEADNASTTRLSTPASGKSTTIYCRPAWLSRVAIPLRMRTMSRTRSASIRSQISSLLPKRQLQRLYAKLLDLRYDGGLERYGSSQRAFATAVQQAHPLWGLNGGFVSNLATYV